MLRQNVFTVKKVLISMRLQSFSFWALLFLSYCHQIFAAPAAHCIFEYCETSKTVVFKPNKSMYDDQSIELFDRFKFKVYMSATANEVNLLNLYTYYLNPKDSKAVLMSEIKYAHLPLQKSLNASSITGKQILYTPIKQRELVYQCWVVESYS